MQTKTVLSMTQIYLQTMIKNIVLAAKLLLTKIGSVFSATKFTQIKTLLEKILNGLAVTARTVADGLI